MNRRTLFNAPFWGLWLLLGWISTAVAVEPVAMVTDLQGGTTLTAERGSAPVALLDYLYPGNRLTVPADASVTLVHFGSGEARRYDGAAEIRVAASGTELVSGRPAKVEQLQIARNIDLGALSGGGITQGAITFRTMRNTPRLVLLHPTDATVLTRQPLFLWQRVGNEGEYQFTIENDQGKVLYQTRVSDNRHQLPNARLLEPGASYRWRVEARLPGGEAYVSSADFALLDADEQRRIGSLEPGANARLTEQILYATYLESIGLGYDAGLYWRRLSDQRPSDPRLRERAL